MYKKHLKECQPLNNNPKLRFKDKNGNAYPEWRIITLGDIFNISAGGDIKKNNCTKEKTDLNIYPVYANALTNDGLYGYTNSYKVKSPAITITGRGDVGHAVSRKEPFYPIVRLLVLQPNTELNTDFYTSAINRTKIFIESTGVPQLTSPQVAKVKLFAPCLEEQEKIAGFLSKVDELINECEGEVKDLEEQKKGLMQKIFSQQIRFKDSNNNPYPDWEEKTLYEITDVRDGTHDSPKYIASGYPLITSKNLTKDGKLDFSDISYISEQDFNEINKRSKVHIGDILFGMIGTIGKPVLIKEDNFAIKNVALIKNNQNNINKYLVHYLQSDNILRQFYVEIAGGTQKFIALGVIRNLIIKLPCQEEQEKITKVLSKMDELIEEKKELLSDWQQFKKGLLQQMFV